MTDMSGVSEYVYDAKGSLVKVTKSTETSQFVTEYTYDDSGRIQSTVYPSGRVVKFSYDETGKIIKLSTEKDGEEKVLADNIAYLPTGPMNALTFGNGLTLNKSFDASSRLTAIDAGDVLKRNYEMDASGNINLIDNLINQDKTLSYNYDQLYRLTTADGGFGAIDYGYDAVGNRLNKNTNGTDETYSYNTDSNRLVKVKGMDNTSFGYDDNGNTISIGDYVLDYNQHNRLKSVEGASEYLYDGKNRRVRKITDHAVLW